MSERISKNDLRQRAGEWIAAGKAVAGPVQVKPGRAIRAAGAADALLLDGWIRHPIRSKSLSSRATSAVRLQDRRAGITLDDLPAEIPEQIIVGAHRATRPPADSRQAVQLGLARRFLQPPARGDDSDHDSLHGARRAVLLHQRGLSPARKRGSERCWWTRATATTRFASCRRRCGLFGAAVSGAEWIPLRRTAQRSVRAGRRGSRARFDPAAVAEFAKEHFEDPFWRSTRWRASVAGLRLHLPVCHCFDIVDEGNPAEACAHGIGMPAVRAVHAATRAPTRARRRARGNGSASITSFSCTREIRRDAVHRLRQLRAQLPVDSACCRCERDLPCRIRISRPHGDHRCAAAHGGREVRAIAFSRTRGARQRVRFPRGPVRHFFGFRLGRIDVQHLFQFDVARPIEFCSAKWDASPMRCGRPARATRWVRGPMAMVIDDEWRGKDLIFLGAHRMPPIRCAIWYRWRPPRLREITSCTERGRGRSVYRDELEQWRPPAVRVVQCVVRAGRRRTGRAKSAFVPTVFERARWRATRSRW